MFLLWKRCDSCWKIFRKRDMIHNIMIGMHYPWSFCGKCYKEFFK